MPISCNEPNGLCIPLDIQTARLEAVIGGWPEPAFLVSGAGFGASGRWSLYAACPRLVFEASGSVWSLRIQEQTAGSGEGRVLETLAGLLARFGLANPADSVDPDACPFQGGLIGFFGYDLAPSLEVLPRKAARDSRLPDLRFALYDTAVVVDHAIGEATLQAHDLLGEGSIAVNQRAEDWLSALRKPARQSVPRSILGPPVSNFRRDAYLDAVRKALEYIAAGDVFQVNLSQRFDAEGAPDPLDLYRRLKARSPAPFSAFLRWKDFAVVSASPEWFYQTRGDRIVTRPIKGTRPRGHTPAADARLAAELAGSPKDRAELTMIVDLERNDLGRVCEYGSIKVLEPVSIESFAQVHHLVATVEGRIRAGLGPIDIVRAVFPGGSITGAPKIRAMQIIDELEPTRRGLYTGGIGYFSRHGASGFNIAIRTMIVEGARVSYQVGGGIVADSDPENEYQETLHKGQGLREVLNAERMS